MSGGLISAVAQTLQNAVIALSSIATSIGQLVIGPSANNNFTGNNTFSGTNTFTGAATFDEQPSIKVGGAVATYLQPSGSVSAQFGAVGNGADTTNDILFTYSLPANAFDIVGRGVFIRSFGDFAANGNNKVVQLVVDNVAIFSSTTLTDNSGWWSLEATLYKSASDVQVGTVTLYHNNTLHGPVTTISTAADTAIITIAVTGASPTTGAANDVVAKGMTVTFMN